MSSVYDLPADYRPLLSTRQIETAIKDIKDFFERNLAAALGLERVTAPLFVRSGTGVNDDLNGVEQPVRFNVKEDGGALVEIVQSLAKWKRLALKRYGYRVGEGIYTDMNAIRPDETLDSIHSIYVDQWDWEKIIAHEERNRQTLEAVVRAIYDAICRTEFHVASQYSGIRPMLPESITCLTSEELYQRWPDVGPREREQRACAEHRAIFVVGIGRRCPTDNRTTAAPRTTTTGPLRARTAVAGSTAISCSGTRCSAGRSRSRRWSSAPTRRRSSAN